MHAQKAMMILVRIAATGFCVCLVLFAPFLYEVRQGEFELGYDPTWSKGEGDILWQLYLLQLGCAAYGVFKMTPTVRDENSKKLTKTKLLTLIIGIVTFGLWFLVGSTVSFAFSESAGIDSGRVRDSFILGGGLLMGAVGLLTCSPK